MAVHCDATAEPVDVRGPSRMPAPKVCYRPCQSGLAVAPGRVSSLSGDKMLRAFRLFAGLVLALLAGSPELRACNLSQWTSATASNPLVSLTAIEPDGTVSRYAGRCAMAARAPANYVTDASPLNESAFRARFYLMSKRLAPNSVPTGTSILFRARNAAGADMITVRFNNSGTDGRFEFATSGGVFASSAVVALDRWYAVELNWAAGAAMTATVQGAGGAALAPVVTTTSVASDRIDAVSLGWISGGSADAIVLVDAYESRRATQIGRICRGDADGSNVRDAADPSSIANEFVGVGLAPLQPDCNEDGRVDAADAICTRNLAAAGTNCNATSTQW